MNRRQPSSGVKWPVTPEVAGSSPVAPVKTLAIRILCCRTRRRIEPDYTDLRSETRSARKRPETGPGWRFQAISGGVRTGHEGGVQLHKAAGGHSRLDVCPAAHTLSDRLPLQRRVRRLDHGRRGRCPLPVRAPAPTAARDPAGERAQRDVTDIARPAGPAVGALRPRGSLLPLVSVSRARDYQNQPLNRRRRGDACSFIRGVLARSGSSRKRASAIAHCSASREPTAVDSDDDRWGDVSIFFRRSCRYSLRLEGAPSRFPFS